MSIASNINGVAGSGTDGQFLGNTSGVPTWKSAPGGSSVYFLANNLADQVNVTGDGTIYTVQFTNVIDNAGSAFDGTSTFTAPSTGVYALGFSIALASTSSFASDTNSVFSIVTTAAEYRFQQYNLAAYAPTQSNAVQINGVTLANMTSGDTAIVYCRVLGGPLDVTVAGTTNYGFRTPLFWGYQVA